jgi:hypothetical protein
LKFLKNLANPPRFEAPAMRSRPAILRWFDNCLPADIEIAINPRAAAREALTA